MFKSICGLVLLAPGLWAGDSYLTVTLDQLTWISEPMPSLGRKLYRGELRQWPQPEVRCNAREGWLGIPYLAKYSWGVGLDNTPLALRELKLSLRGQAHQRVAGELWLATRDGLPERFQFVVTLGEESDTGRGEFLKSRYQAYAWRQAFDLRGAAWWRHCKESTAQELEGMGLAQPHFPPSVQKGSEAGLNLLDESYGLFSGGRAVAQNLALNDRLDPGTGGQDNIALSTIPGVEVPAITWKPWIGDKHPQLDPLASHLPADQHAVFFPNFGAFVRVFDELRTNGIPVLKLLESDAEDARVLARYERQLCLALDRTTRILGSSIVTRVALTGGDPHFRTGTDVALLLETPNPGALMIAMAARQRGVTALIQGVREVAGSVGDVEYRGLVTEDRAICSYLARLGDDVLLTNSLDQLQRMVDVDAGHVESLVDQDEYRWFRDRYPLGEQEDAFAIVTDATIRRWTSPRWRIGCSRRTRAAGRLAEHQATRLALALEDGRLPEALALVDPTYGSLDFMTPINELEFEFVTRAELEAYARFRNRYSRLWTKFFDPLAARIVVQAERLELDLTVRPIATGMYDNLRWLTQNSSLQSTVSGDPAWAPLHFSFALSNQRYKEFLIGTFGLPNLNCAWMGEDFSIGLEGHLEFWLEAAQADDLSWFLMENRARIPCTFRVESRDRAGLESYLQGLLQKKVVPAWGPQVRTHRGQDYLAIVNANSWGASGPLYCVALSDAWVASFYEDIIQSVIDRDQAATACTPQARLGESLALRLGPQFQQVLEGLVGNTWGEQRQAEAWRALPILDEWRRLAPDVDPLELHQLAFGEDLLGPDGGHYGWDPVWGRSTNSVYGHPGSPLLGERLPSTVMAIKTVEFGITFESGDGLRAQIRLTR